MSKAAGEEKRSHVREGSPLHTAGAEGLAAERARGEAGGGQVGGGAGGLGACTLNQATSGMAGGLCLRKIPLAAVRRL